MKTKNKLMFGMFLFSILFFTALVSSAITFNTPSTTGDTITGTYDFNITTTIVATEESYQCNWSTTSDGIFNATLNLSASSTEFNFSYDTSLLTEAEDTILTVNCSNSTDSETGTLTINIDNTNPVCSFTLGIGENTVDYMDAYGVYPSDASTDTTDLTYAWILYDPSTNSQQTSTSTTPNFASDDFDEIGEFVLSLIVTDEAGKTNACTNQTIMVKGSNGGTITPSIISSIEENKTQIFVIGGGFILIVLGGVGFVLINKSKKQ